MHLLLLLLQAGAEPVQGAKELRDWLSMFISAAALLMGLPGWYLTRLQLRKAQSGLDPDASVQQVAAPGKQPAAPAVSNAKPYFARPLMSPPPAPVQPPLLAPLDGADTPAAATVESAAPVVSATVTGAAATPALTAPPAAAAIVLTPEQERFIGSYAWGAGCPFYFFSRGLFLFYMGFFGFNFLSSLLDNKAAAQPDMVNLLAFSLLSMVLGLAAYGVQIAGGAVGRRRRWSKLRWQSFEQFRANERAWQWPGVVAWIVNGVGVALILLGVYAIAAAPARVLGGEVTGGGVSLYEQEAIDILHNQSSLAGGDLTSYFVGDGVTNTGEIVVPFPLLPSDYLTHTNLTISGTYDPAAVAGALRAKDGSFNITWHVGFDVPVTKTDYDTIFGLPYSYDTTEHQDVQLLQTAVVVRDLQR